VAHWIDVLRANKRAVFAATSQAQKAVDWMTQAGGEVA
jgi:antirestriction protein ArdC